jgi:hypothetical protein
MKGIQTLAESDLHGGGNQSINEFFKKLPQKDRSLYQIQDINSFDEGYDVFISVPENRYFIALRYSNTQNPSLLEAEFVPHYDVYLSITSDVLSFEDIRGAIGLDPTDGWSLGDRFRGGKRIMNFSSAKYRPNSKTGEACQVKVDDLLDLLKPYEDSISRLSEHADCKLVISVWSHISSYIGYILTNNQIKILAKLNVDMDYMPYVFYE